MSHDSKLNLFQRIHKVMGEIGYVQKTVGAGAGASVKGVARDEVVAQIRQKLLDNGIIASTSQVGTGRNIETAAKSSSGTPLCIYVGLYSTTFINVDNPLEQLAVCHEGQGNDYGDKAPGKAATYAEKLNFVKGLMLETGIADEGRNPGEGDDSGAADNSKKSAGAIKTPRAKEEPAPKAVDDSGPASAGLLKMFRAAAEQKGVLDKVDAAIAKRGDKVTKKWVAGQMERLAEAQGREPGSEG
jgi:hypothetical protein